MTHPTQLTLLLGRVIRTPDPDDETGSYYVELTPMQAKWMGDAEPKVPTCPGCVLFGCCALHDYPKQEKAT